MAAASPQSRFFGTRANSEQPDAAEFTQAGMRPNYCKSVIRLFIGLSNFDA